MRHRRKNNNRVNFPDINSFINDTARRIDQRLAERTAALKLQERASSQAAVLQELDDPTMDKFRIGLSEGISGLFNSDDQAEVALYLGDHKLPAHAAILTIQSEYFKKALGQDFLEKKTKEFCFNEGSPHAYWRVVEFMYCGKYSEDIDVLGSPDDDELVKAVRVYVLADYF